MFNLIRSFFTLGAIVGTLPFNIVDGQVIDAVPVMGNFNFIASQVNANVPSLIGTNTFVNTGSTGGSANAITLTPTPAILAYQQGQQFTFIPFAVNTGATTVAVSGLAARALKTAFGTALTGGELQIGGVYTIVDNGANYVLQNSAQGTGIVTFTPTILFGGAAVGVTYTTQTGFGMKVNNIFFWCLSVVLSSKGASTGSVDINIPPYACNAAWVDSVFPVLVDNVTITGTSLVGFANAGTTLMSVVMNVSGGVPVAITDAECTNTSAFAMQGFYPV